MAGSRGAGPSRLFFFKRFLSAPGQVGSIIPTAQATIRRLLAPIDWSATRCVVEYGPGTGVFTRALLARLPQTAKLVAIDTDPDFIAFLGQTIADPRLIAVNGSAADVQNILASHGLNKADYIISGLPFSTLPKGLGDVIMGATANALKPGGQFLVYQYSDFVLAMLRHHFAQVTHIRSWLCIPPAKLFWAKKTLVSGLTPEIEPARDGVVQHAHHLIGEPPAQ